MSYIDIAIIVIVGLGAILGFARGFFKTVISFFGWIVSILVAVFLAKVVAESLLDIPFIKSFVIGGGEGFSLTGWIHGFMPEALNNMTIQNATQDGINSALGGNFFASMLAPLISMVVTAAGGSSTASVGEAFSLLIANTIFIIITGIALLIIIRLLMCLFTMFANSLTKFKAINVLNRLLGLVIGAAKGAMFVVLFFVISSYFLASPALAPYVNELEKSTIAKPVSDKVIELTDKYINGDDGLLNKLLQMAGFMPAGNTTDEEKALAKMTDEEKAYYNAFALLSASGVPKDSPLLTTGVYKDYFVKLKAFEDGVKSTIVTSVNAGTGVGVTDAVAKTALLTGDIKTAYLSFVGSVNATTPTKEDIDAKYASIKTAVGVFETTYAITLGAPTADPVTPPVDPVTPPVVPVTPPVDPVLPVGQRANKGAVVFGSFAERGQSYNIIFA